MENQHVILVPTHSNGGAYLDTDNGLRRLKALTAKSPLGLTW